MTASAINDIYRARVAKYMHKPDYCCFCTWRRVYILQEAGSTDAPVWACDSQHPRILHALHQLPDPTWTAIIATGRLCSPSQVIRYGRQWTRIPLRIDQVDQQIECSANAYEYEGRWLWPHQAVVGFHNARLESLIRPTHSWNGRTVGNGILWEGRLRYGNSTHNKNAGVNIYADGGCETFYGPQVWGSLEVHCTNTKRLQGGRPGRYCVNGPFNHVCTKVVIVALWVPSDQVPWIVKWS